jgi:hypothetical protein
MAAAAAAAADLVEDVYPITGTVMAVDGHAFTVRLESHSKWLALGPGVVTMTMDVRSPAGSSRPLSFVTTAMARQAPHGHGHHYSQQQQQQQQQPPLGGPQTPLVVRVEVDPAVAPTADWSDRPDLEDDEAMGLMVDLVAECRSPGALVTLRGLTQNVARPPCEQTPCELLETLSEFVGAWGLQEGRPMAPEHCYDILQAGCLEEDGAGRLGPASPREALQAAALVLYKLLSDMEAVGRACGVFGDGTGQAVARTNQLNLTLLRVSLALGSAECLANLREAMSPDYDISLPNCHGYSVVPRKGTRKTPKVEMLEHLLDYCAVRGLRHQGDMVFAEQCVPPAVDLRWRGAACRAPGCGVEGPEVMFDAVGPPGAPGVHAGPLCLDHAAAAIQGGLQVVNVVFQTGATWGADDALRRTATAKRPRWLVNTYPASCRTPTKTWVPEVRRGMGLNTRPRTCGDLVVDALDVRQQNRVMWETYVSAGNARVALQDYLRETQDPKFPLHTPMTCLFAFNNGMYSIEENRFCPYGALPNRWATQGAINFVAEHFDPLWTRQPLDALGVPGYDDILRTQGYKPDTVAYLDAFLGRLLYPAKKYDHWQLAIVFLGTAGSGKSSVARAVAMLLRDQNVGNLPSNCEEQWAVATLTGKICVMCTEMKQDFRLPNSVLQTMIAGEPVTVHEKFKNAFDIESWESQLMLVGNVMPTAWYVDEGSPMQRRAMVFHANIKPSSQDPSIQARFYGNLGPFLVRISRRYMELVARVDASRDAGGKCHARDFMPDQVVAFNNAFKNETSTAAVFLDHLLSMYDLGFRDDFAPGAVVDLTKDAQLVEFFKYMREARAAAGAGTTPRFPQVDLPEALSLAVHAAAPGTLLTRQGLEEYVLEKRVPLRTLKNIYGSWWKESVAQTGGAGGRGGRAAAPDFNNILREIGLPVCVDMDGSPTERFVFGISVRAATGAGGAGTASMGGHYGAGTNAGDG